MTEQNESTREMVLYQAHDGTVELDVRLDHNSDSNPHPNSHPAAACHCSGAGRAGWGGTASRVISSGAASGYSAAAAARPRTSRSRVPGSARSAHT